MTDKAMEDMNVTFIGGTLDGQKRSPINKEELSILGYRIKLNGHSVGGELSYSIAVPIEFTEEEARNAMQKMRPSRNRDK